MSTQIEWTQETWNPIVGCTPISAGCENCYASRAAAGPWLFNHPKYKGLTKGGKWTGKIGYGTVKELEQPLRWKKPRMIFVESMGDLFHKDVPFEEIAKVFYIIAICYWHKFQILTKRPKRMLEFFKWIEKEKRGFWGGDFAVLCAHLPTKQYEEMIEPYLTYHARMRKHYHPDLPETPDKLGDAGIYFKWPLPNLWLGVTVENHDNIERIEYLRKTPAAKRFVSLEPLLDVVSIRCLTDNTGDRRYTDNLDWVIIGAETGPGRRICKLDWVRKIIGVCKFHYIPVFVKKLEINGKITGNMEDWSKNLRVREYPKQEIKNASM